MKTSFGVYFLGLQERGIDLVIFNTDEMNNLIRKFEPYMNEHHQLPDDAPDDIKEAFLEYQRLGKEQMEFAYSL